MFWRKRFAKILQIIIYELQFWKKMSLRQVVVWTKSHRPLFFTIGFSFGCCQTKRKIQILILLAFNDSKENAAFTFFTFSEAQSGIKTLTKRRKKVKWKMSKWMISVFAFLQHTKKSKFAFFPFFLQISKFSRQDENFRWFPTKLINVTGL